MRVTGLLVLAFSKKIFFFKCVLTNRERGTTLESVRSTLESVWKKFLETVSSSGTDFLSLEHLGNVLQCLAAKGHSLMINNYDKEL